MGESKEKLFDNLPSAHGEQILATDWHKPPIIDEQCSNISGGLTLKVGSSSSPASCIQSSRDPIGPQRPRNTQAKEILGLQ